MASSTLESSLGPGDEASYLALAPGPAFVADLEGRVKAVNAEWERVLGFSQDELRGRPFAELLHPDDRPALEGVGSALRRGEIVWVLKQDYPHLVTFRHLQLALRDRNIPLVPDLRLGSREGFANSGRTVREVRA